MLAPQYGNTQQYAGQQQAAPYPQFSSTSSSSSSTSSLSNQNGNGPVVIHHMSQHSTSNIPSPSV